MRRGCALPLHHLQGVVCFGHVSLSTPLMHRLADDGLALVLLDARTGASRLGSKAP